MTNLSRDMKVIKDLKTKREPIVEKCMGCENIKDTFCNSYAHPKAKWRVGTCPRATHVVTELSKEKNSRKRRFRVGQQKQKKKGA